MQHNKSSSVPAPTTAQSLGSLLKSARDIMRKDKGLNGDTDRLPMLTWIMFLKFLDDLEIQREQEASLAGKSLDLPSNPLIVGGIGRQKLTASQATSSSPSSIKTRLRGRTAREAKVSSLTSGV